MNDSNVLDKSSTFLAIAPATRGAKRCALTIIIALMALPWALIPFSRIPLPRIHNFVPIFDTVVATSDFVTAGFLFVGYRRSRLIVVLVIAFGYAFTFTIAVVSLFSFPGLSPWNSQLGAVAWLERLRSGGFPMFVIGYALLGRHSIGKRQLANRFFCVILVAASAICLLMLFAAAGHPFSGPSINRGGATASMIWANAPVWIPSLTALAVLATRSPYSILHLWLLVVASAWLINIVLITVFNSGHLDLGFAAGNLCRLFAASTMPVVLLVEAGRLAGRLDDALAVAEERNAELARSREELAQAQRLEAVGQLTGGVAHDFNNLLTVVIGNLELILRSHGDVAKIDRLAQSAIRAAQRGEHLVKQLLTYARKQISHPQTVNLNQLIANVENLMRRVISEQIEVVTILSPVLAPVRIDPAQFEATLLNLVINSRDAITAGGRITIETMNVTVDQHRAGNDPEAPPGSYVVVAVSDTGTGMTPSVLAKAFDPFFTTKEAGKGSGLGLSQAYGFAKTAGGQVKIHSEPGVGTIVKLYLPQSADRAVFLATDANTPLPQPARNCGTILVVEDDEDVLAVTAESLIELGYQVLTAVDTQQALKILGGDQPIDLLFSDVILPGGMNGAQLAMKARHLRPDLKVLLTSGYAAAAVSLEQPQPDHLDVVSKPYQREELARKIHLVMLG